MLACVRAWGHPSHQPVRASFSAEPEHYSPAIGGYGYYARSEAEAADAFRFGCSNAERLDYIARGCSRVIPTGTDPTTIVTDTMRAFLLQRIREHEFESTALQLAAINPSRSNPPTLPSCLAPNAELSGLFASLPAAQPSDADIASATEPRKSQLAKFRVAGNTLTSGNLVRASMTYDKLKSAQDRRCGSSASSSGAVNSICTDLQNQIQRLQASFPALFGTSVRAYQGTMVTLFSERERAPLTNAVKQLLGSRNPAATTDADRVTRGGAIYNSAMTADAADSLTNLEIQLAQAANEARNPTASTPTGLRPAMTSALSTLDGSVATIRSNYATSLSSQVSGICDRNLADFLTQNPNTVRQALMDLPADQRLVAQAVLCQNSLFSTARPLRACEGVTRATSATGTTTSVDRRDSSYPYGSSVRYQIDRPSSPAGAPPVISTELQIVVDPDVPGATARIAEMERQANAYYNCETGHSTSIASVPGLIDVPSCPRDPAMANPRAEFRIRFRAVSASAAREPKVNLHRCYRAELASPDDTNCDRVRGYRVTKCRETIAMWQSQGSVGGSSRWGMDLDTLLASNISRAPVAVPSGVPLTDQQKAERVYAAAPAGCNTPANIMTAPAAAISTFCDCFPPPAGDPANNRADSGNYTSNISAATVIHEVGHILALPDEYIDPTYAISSVGEHDSMMNHSSETARHYPRHIRMVLAAEGCRSPASGSTP